MGLQDGVIRQTRRAVRIAPGHHRRVGDTPQRHRVVHPVGAVVEAQDGRLIGPFDLGGSTDARPLGGTPPADDVLHGDSGRKVRPQQPPQRQPRRRGGVGEIPVQRFPVERLGDEQLRQVEQPGLLCSLEAPQHCRDHFGTPGGCPHLQWPARQVQVGIAQVLLDERWHSIVARGRVMRQEHVEHYHARPPVQVVRRPEETVVTLTGQRPLDPLARGAA